MNKKLSCKLGIHKPDGNWGIQLPRGIGVCYCEKCRKIFNEHEYAFGFFIRKAFIALVVLVLISLLIKVFEAIL